MNTFILIAGLMFPDGAFQSVKWHGGEFTSYVACQSVQVVQTEAARPLIDSGELVLVCEPKK